MRDNNWQGNRSDSSQTQPIWTGGSLAKEEITKGVSEKTVEWAERFGKYLAKNPNAMTTTQIRRFYGEVKRQQVTGWKPSDFAMLKPKLAYAVGRDKNKTKIRDFYDEMSKLFPAVTGPKEFDNFVKVYEAVVAYHKANAEEKDKN